MPASRQLQRRHHSRVPRRGRRLLARLPHHLGAHRCDSETCSGGSGQPSRRRRLTDGDDDPYCTAGHTGPLCEVCVADSDYFSSAEGRCVACPSTARSAGIFVGFVIVIAVLAAAYAGLRRLPFSRRLRRRAARIESAVGLQPKFKIVVGFYQVSSILGLVYGVRLDEHFTRWLDVLKLFSLDLFGVQHSQPRTA